MEQTELTSVSTSSIDVASVVTDKAASINFSSIPEDLKQHMKKFRFRKEKTIAAIIFKINTVTNEVEIEEEFEDCTIDEVREEVCEHQPRYIVISYVYAHSDGRVSYPYFFVYFTPRGGNPQLQMRYAGTKTQFQETLKITKSLDIADTEELTCELLDSKVEFYR